MPFRILRAVKNRFGPTDEIGVFEMAERGLPETPNPSALFLGAMPASAPAAPRCSPAWKAHGPCWWRSRRSPRRRHTARRAAPWSAGTARRLAMILAVLETRCGLGFGGRDVYLSVAGGLRITEPAADLAVAAALISALADEPLPKDAWPSAKWRFRARSARPAATDVRLKEAAKLGFKTAFAPPGRESGAKGEAMSVRPIARIGDLVARCWRAR